MTSFDVAIIGAGTAGSAAACMLSPSVSVALVDRVDMPGWRIGETLPGAARRLLVALGGWDRFAAAGHGPAPLKVSRWGSDSAVELDAMRDPDGVGWRLDRARFEVDLRADAVARGATFVGASVSGLVRTRDGWQLSLDDGNTIAARRLIDASGRRSRLLRGFGQRRMVMDRLACVYQRVPQTCSTDPTTYTQSVPEGWWYSAMLPDGDRLVAFHADADAPSLRRALHVGPLTIALELPGMAEAIGPVDATLSAKPKLCAANSVARSAAGDGWLAAGDSAMALDPLSSQGLFNALATGLEAGEATLALLNGDSGATQAYAARMSRIWQAYVGHHAMYYGMETRWTDAPFWARRTLQ
ncbi:MAG: tryptophan 7-halogenase [Pseudomonadota bacterium]|nr:tryptophan 7-halogenase [Pseudomonadota bacterium]